MFTPEGNFLVRTEPKKEATKEEIKDIEYQKEFMAYFTNLLRGSGFEGAYKFIEHPIATREGVNNTKYTFASNDMASQLNNTDPNSRLKLLADVSGIDMTIPRTTEEVTAILRERVNVAVFEQARSDTSIDDAHRNILELMYAMLDPHTQEIPPGIPELPTGEVNRKVGFCREAERQLLSFMSGKNSRQEMGEVNAILDEKGAPVMLEKLGIGNDYSCLTLVPVLYNGYLLRPGAIFVVDENDEKVKPKRGQAVTGTIDLSSCKAFRFIRYSMLSIAPEDRTKVGPQFAWFYENQVPEDTNYDWVTPEILAELTEVLLKNLKG